MKFGKSLFARLMRKSKVVEPDAFDLRLQRIGLRERRCAARVGVFRTLPSRLAV